jgi:hypothetical protein
VIVNIWIMGRPIHVTFEVLIVMNMSITIFCDVTHCGLLHNYPNFVETFCQLVAAEAADHQKLWYLSTKVQCVTFKNTAVFMLIHILMHS